jgi:hypothetical protein
MNNLKWLISQYFRWKNPDPVIGMASLFAKLGTALIAPSGLLFIFSIKTIELPLGFELGAQTVNQAAWVGFALILSSIAIGFYRASKISSLSKTIIILHRGMDGMTLASPEKDLPTKYKIGQVDYINIPNQLSSIQGQFEDIESVPRDIIQRLTQVDHSNTKLLYCGLAPIPLLFFAGYKLQVREKIEIMDYQRNPQKWIFMDDSDDHEELKISLPDNITSPEIAISIGFSFEVNNKLIRDQLGDNVEVIKIELDRGARMDSMLSAEKQNRILKLIVESLVQLRSNNPQIKAYHLFMSAQASFTVNFGRHWTTTVLPSIRVYNFDSKNNSYPWNVGISHDQTQLHID